MHIYDYRHSLAQAIACIRMGDYDLPQLEQCGEAPPSSMPPPAAGVGETGVVFGSNLTNFFQKGQRTVPHLIELIESN